MQTQKPNLLALAPMLHASSAPEPTAALASAQALMVRGNSVWILCVPSATGLLPS